MKDLLATAGFMMFWILTWCLAAWLLVRHCPARQELSCPHGVPSAQGKFLVWHTSRPLDVVTVHHRAAHVVLRSGQC